MIILNVATKKLWLPLVLGSGLVWGVQTAQAEGMGGTSAAGEEGDIKEYPTFQEVDKNGDHYVTKDELADYPDLLKHFDMVDAGKTGKLEEHEYGSLILEKAQSRGR